MIFVADLLNNGIQSGLLASEFLLQERMPTLVEVFPESDQAAA